MVFQFRKVVRRKIIYLFCDMKEYFEPKIESDESDESDEDIENEIEKLRKENQARKKEEEKKLKREKIKSFLAGQPLESLREMLNNSLLDLSEEEETILSEVILKKEKLEAMELPPKQELTKEK